MKDLDDAFLRYVQRQLQSCIDTRFSTAAVHDLLCNELGEIAPRVGVSLFRNELNILATVTAPISGTIVEIKL